MEAGAQDAGHAGLVLCTKSVAEERQLVQVMNFRIFMWKRVFKLHGLARMADYPAIDTNFYLGIPLSHRHTPSHQANKGTVQHARERDTEGEGFRAA